MDDDDLDSSKAARRPSSPPPSSPPTATCAVVVPEGASYRAAERRLVRKLDLHIIPLVMSLYLFSFLDRVNIGNARLYSLEADLGLSPKEFQVAVSILFVTYLALEVPSNLVLKLFTPRRWLAAIVTAWGLVATLSALVRSYGGLVACRLLLGALEAGLFPGLNVYLTLFYTKRELALRVGYLFVSAAAAGALGGLLAYGIGHLDGASGLHGWRWILLIEGLPAVVLGIVTAVALPNDARDAYFLDEQDKALMEARKRAEYGACDDFLKVDMVRAFTDWKVWAFCLAQLGVDTMLYGFSTFLPTIIDDLNIGGWSVAQVQLLTVPCYFLGAAAYMATAVVSDRLQMRGLFCVVFGVISSLGPKPDAPRYIRGHAVTLAMVAMGTLLYAFLWFWYSRENKRRERGVLSEAHRLMKDDELEKLGDDSPHYRYTT
ncbi:hypothetical protein CDD80_151 [Ophiocordyceps camponoti-rufipedis]|uniref:Major facilitator superfamily (MFS) profile domain-containing protein n=1 Tax=Ophiocordyceps camponoti-rufipedis TaxID=2004952 RepID=A0A2C5ZD84_9HYPO|nr:hypothetical protein CDD80_151 [Ophiocordyceps camponoti-rufipedis]